MTLTPTYDSVLSRVQLACTLLGSDCTWALVQRSTDGTTWTTVRGASEWDVTTESFTTTLDDYEFPADTLTTYRASPYDDVNFPVDTPLNGLVIDGTSGDRATTPDAASLDIVGDIDLRAEATPRDWTPSGNQTFVSKYTASGNQRSYKFQLNTAGTLSLLWSTDGTAVTTKTSTVAVTPPASGKLAVRVTLDVDNGAAGNDVKFYTASSITGTWTQLGATVTTGGVTSIFSSTAGGNIGASDSGTVDRFAGVIHKCIIMSGIAGTQVANPDFTIQANNATSFADTATPAKTWTIQNNAELVVPQTNTITPDLTEVWLKSIVRPYLNRAVRVVGVSEITRAARNGVFNIIGRSYPIAVTDLRSSRQLNLTIRTATREASEEFDLVLASGDPILLHSPPNTDHLWLPSEFYAVIGDTSQSRLGIKTETLSDFTLPLTETAAPDPDIVGITTSWASIVASYATWADVIAAFADWAAVLESIGSEEDVIVP
jgi:hypothetical protein